MPNFLCVVCHETIVDPVTFMCQHTFCRHCILTLSTCPTCRLPIFVPPAKNNMVIDAIIDEVGLDAYETRINNVNSAAAELTAQQQLEYKVRSQIWREVVSTVGSQNQRIIEIHTEPKYNNRKKIIVIFSVLVMSSIILKKIIG